MMTMMQISSNARRISRVLPVSISLYPDRFLSSNVEKVEDIRTRNHHQWQLPRSFSFRIPRSSGSSSITLLQPLNRWSLSSVFWILDRFWKPHFRCRLKIQERSRFSSNDVLEPVSQLKQMIDYEQKVVFLVMILACLDWIYGILYFAQWRRNCHIESVILGNCFEWKVGKCGD